MCPQVGRGERGDVHGVAQRLVAGGVDEVAEDLPVVLDASTLGVAVPQENELLLLPGPQPTDTLLVDLRGKACVPCPWGQRAVSEPRSGAEDPSA